MREAEDRAARFLAMAADPNRGRIAAAGVAVVVAHPDDETIGCGALLARLDDVTLVLVTDGAPRNESDARAHGFSDAASYAAARRSELDQALGHAGIEARAIVSLGVADQEAALALADIARRLARLFAARNIGLVLTHAYEGGHPDHDATAFAVHGAAALLARSGREVAVIEMPYYRMEAGAEIEQRFAPDENSLETAIALTQQEQALKARMTAAHATQAAVLSRFALDTERFRIAAPPHFSQAPKGGEFLYDRRDWGMNGLGWLALARRALAEIVSDERS